MDYFLVLIIGFIIGFMMGETLLAFRISKVVNKKLLTTKISEPEIYQLYIETEQGILYLWDSQKSEFVCQAKTVDELAKLALEYKNIQYAAVLHGEQNFMFVNGTVKEHK